MEAETVDVRAWRRIVVQLTAAVGQFKWILERVLERSEQESGRFAQDVLR